MTLTRTPVGLVNSFLLYSTPLVWVEGPDDVVPVETIVDGIPCTVKSAGGIPNCMYLIEALKAADLPYAVLVDGEFNVLRKTRSPHRRGVTLLRHSVENYYADIWVSTRVCRRIEGSKVDEQQACSGVEALLTAFEKATQRLVTLDVAGWIAGDDRSFFPDRAEPILAQGQPVCDTNRVAVHEGQAGTATLAKESVAANLLLGQRIAHSMRGHVLFGFLRAAVSQVLDTCGSKLSCNNAALRAIFAEACWRTPPPSAKEHRSIKSRLRRAAREAGKVRQKFA